MSTYNTKCDVQETVLVDDNARCASRKNPSSIRRCANYRSDDILVASSFDAQVLTSLVGGDALLQITVGSPIVSPLARLHIIPFGEPLVGTDPPFHTRAPRPSPLQTG